MYSVMTTDRSNRSRMISFRVSEDEERLLLDVSDDIMKRNPYLKRTDVYRELMGLADTGIVTDADRKRLRSGGSIRHPGRPYPIIPANDENAHRPIETTKRRKAR